MKQTKKKLRKKVACEYLINGQITGSGLNAKSGGNGLVAYIDFRGAAHSSFGIVDCRIPVHPSQREIFKLGMIIGIRVQAFEG